MGITEKVGVSIVRLLIMMKTQHKMRWLYPIEVWKKSHGRRSMVEPERPAVAQRIDPSHHHVARLPTLLLLLLHKGALTNAEKNTFCPCATTTRPPHAPRVPIRVVVPRNYTLLSVRK